ncbi:MAG: VapC toxin family domain ribonuclease [Subtercola sp.]|nr:VapC toxin family domain ribonuclease [Subtercola sp.]
MIVDTSAIVAIVAREEGWQSLVEQLELASSVSMSSVSILELTIVLGSERFGLSVSEVHGLLSAIGVAAIDFTAAHEALASDAHALYGKGKHPARLNFGDCIAYASARLARDTLLFVGDDFSQTDLASYAR